MSSHEDTASLQGSSLKNLWWCDIVRMGHYDHQSWVGSFLKSLHSYTLQDEHKARTPRFYCHAEIGQTEEPLAKIGKLYFLHYYHYLKTMLHLQIEEIYGALQ